MRKCSSDGIPFWQVHVSCSSRVCDHRPVSILRWCDDNLNLFVAILFCSSIVRLRLRKGLGCRWGLINKYCNRLMVSEFVNFFLYCSRNSQCMMQYWILSDVLSYPLEFLVQWLCLLFWWCNHLQVLHRCCVEIWLVCLVWCSLHWTILFLYTQVVLFDRYHLLKGWHISFLLISDCLSTIFH